MLVYVCEVILGSGSSIDVAATEELAYKYLADRISKDLIEYVNTSDDNSLFQLEEYLKHSNYIEAVRLFNNIASIDNADIYYSVYPREIINDEPLKESKTLDTKVDHSNEWFRKYNGY